MEGYTVKKLLLPLVALAFLGGCQGQLNAVSTAAALASANISQDDFNKAQVTYAGLLVAFNTYRYSDAAFTIPRPYCTTSKPFSPANICAKYSVLSAVQPYVRKLETARVDLQACVVNSCSNVSALWIAFTDALKSASAEKIKLGAF